MTRPISILHVGKFYYPHVGGMETHLRSLVLHQSQRATVEVLVAGTSRSTSSEMLDGARITRVATFGSVASMPLTPGLLWKLRGRSDDIVHLHTPNPGAAAAFVASGHPGKLVITHQGDTLGRAALRRISDPFVRRAMAKASAVIVTSKRYLDSSAELQDFRSKCHIIPLALDLEMQASVNEEEAAVIRSRYGPKMILAVGRLVPYKGFAYLIRALRKVDATLVLIGSGPLLEELQATAIQEGVADRIHFLGHVQNLSPYLHAARFFVMPSISRAESFGLVQLEAMAAGLPVINTDLESGVPEVSLHGVSGLTVPPCDEGALATAMSTLLCDRELRVRLGLAARMRAATFSATAMAARHAVLYEQVLQR